MEPGGPLPGRRAITEVAAAAGAVGLGLFVVLRLATTQWAEHFLFGGDSVLLPLVARSLTSGERLDWTFSSSTFFFPELGIYLLADLVTPTTQWALIVNALVNTVALYVLVRVALRSMPEVSATRRRLAALGVVASLAVCVALERDAVPLTATAFTLFYGTYYAGVTLVGLALVALWVTSGDAARQHARRALVAALTAACTASDPLLITHVAAPLLLAGLTARRVAAHRRSLPGRLDAAALAGGVMLGLAVRATVLRGWIAGGVDSYVAGPGQAIDRFSDLLAAQLDDPLLRIELAYAAALTAFAVARPIWLAVTRRDAGLSASTLLVADLAGWTAISVFGSQLVTGNLLSRYLGILLVVPHLSLAAVRVPLPAATALRAAVVLVAVALTGRAVIGAGHIRGLAERRPSGEACLLASAERAPGLDGVGHFWRARAFDTHLDRPAVRQVNSDFTVYHWLVNAGSYDGHRFGFVLVDLDTSQRPGITAEQTQGMLGPPDAIDRCDGFEVWHYGPANPGHITLNERIAASM